MISLMWMNYWSTVLMCRWFTADPASINIEQVALTLREAKVCVHILSFHFVFTDVKICS